jgi:uncharacterized damage-inducible protein DinB
MTRTIAAFFTICLAALPAAAQPAPANPLATSLKSMFDGVKRNIVEAAEAMPESEYGFKPTPEVRSFGELVGHLANGNYSYCSAAKGEKSPAAENYEKTTAKASLVKALKESIAYCDGIYAAQTDATIAQMIKMGPASRAVERPRLNPLVTNISHDNEHYGNIVTYMRLKGHVPPSTARTSSQGGE